MSAGSADTHSDFSLHNAYYHIKAALQLQHGRTTLTSFSNTSSEAENDPGITTPFDDGEATVGNGVMVAMQMKSEAEVDAFYNKALALGGTDEGAPGQRIEGFYAGYFRDLDGNKLNAFVLG